MRFLLLLIFLLGTSPGSLSAQVREIDWNDLLPKEETPFDDPFADLTEEQLLDLGMVARIRYLLKSEKISPDGADANDEKTIVARLTDQGIDVDWLLSQRERIATLRQEQAEAVDAGIDGQLVRIPGYMLPLQRDENGVIEFLLVPWVGACIHTPPPPPNQMIHVSVPGGTEDKGRFAAIWLEGQIDLEPASYDLFLVDGTRTVNVAYTMTTDTITDYSSTESDTLAQVTIPEEALAGHSWWQRWQTKVSILFTRTMTDIKDRRTSGPLFVGLLIAFLYGVVHTLGPGHGKAVVVSYFVGQGGSLGKGIGMGVRIAVFHVLSALVIVLLTDFAVRQVTGNAPADYRTIRLVSYAGIAAIGLFMLRSALRQARLKHHHNEHDETHHHHPGCAACDALESKKGPAAWLSLAVGAVPCTGALLVLLYGLANDMLWPAVLMVVAISLGMALTLSALGIAAILGRRMMNQRVGEDRERQHRLTNGLRIAAALVITLIGAGLLTFTLMGARSVSPNDPNPSKTLPETGRTKPPGDDS